MNDTEFFAFIKKILENGSQTKSVLYALEADSEDDEEDEHYLENVVFGVSKMSFNIFSRFPLAITTRISSSATCRAVLYLDCMPPLPALLFEGCMYLSKSSLGVTTRIPSLCFSGLPYIHRLCCSTAIRFLPLPFVLPAPTTHRYP